jgi:TonB family protein
MNLRTLWNDDNILWEALLLSFGLHFLLLHAGQLTFQLKQKHTVEIDITNLGRMGMTVPKRTPAPAPPKPAAKPKEWIQPKPGQKVAPASVPTQPVPTPPPEEPPPPAEYNIGTGGESVLSRLPQLLNLSDLGAILKRFYPEEARTQGRESTVVLDLHIDGEGHVTNADVVQSGGADFDAAAQRVVKLLRFTPAFLGSQRVAVKMRQAIRFKLES